MVVSSIDRCTMKGRASMSRFGIEEPVDLALAGAALLRFGNVLEIDFESFSGPSLGDRKAHWYPALERFRTLGIGFRN